MHNNYKKLSIFQWLDGKENSQVCRTSEQTYKWLSQDELSTYFEAYSS
jgi:hypothetical protein